MTSLEGLRKCFMKAFVSEEAGKARLYEDVVSQCWGHIALYVPRSGYVQLCGVIKADLASGVRQGGGGRLHACFLEAGSAPDAVHQGPESAARWVAGRGEGSTSNGTILRVES